MLTYNHYRQYAYDSSRSDWWGDYRKRGGKKQSVAATYSTEAYQRSLVRPFLMWSAINCQNNRGKMQWRTCDFPKNKTRSVSTIVLSVLHTLPENVQATRRTCELFQIPWHSDGLCHFPHAQHVYLCPVDGLQLDCHSQSVRG